MSTMDTVPQQLIGVGRLAVPHLLEDTYDALGRLVTILRADGSTAIYAYDAAGNRMSVNQ